MNSCEQTNVLLVTVGAHGHLNPILTLGKCLVSKGLHVTLATTHNILKNTFGIDVEIFSDGIPKDYNGRPSMDYYMDTLSKFGPINLLALIRAHRSKFSCIIGTPFVPWVVDVADELGVPTAMLWIQPCALFKIYHCFYNQLIEFPTESNPNIIVKLHGLPKFSPDELPSFVLPTNKVRSFDSILNNVFHNLHKWKWVLGNSFTELENEVIGSLDDVGCEFWPVGPLVPARLLGKEDDDGFDYIKSNGESDCITWLNKQKPCSVVYISFGSVLSLSEKEIENIAAGLKATNRPFLWVVKTPGDKEVKELGFLEDIKWQGLIVRWSPQTEVLSHSSVGCFLSHCGWNSLLESLAAGVPVIACPQWTDQPTNAKLVTDIWGVGVKLKKDLKGVVSGEEVSRCVEEVMGGRRSEEFRKNALVWKAVAREALVDGGSSDKNIELFVNEVISCCSSYKGK
ncbi:hypothetical protein QVD17_30267 [Tagetes erecta]|uniref:Glycosyltransferase n=1 Tax=Tagetes erecta TaxID=13708 RepID=A0AAD8K531_TARER|nr:hypothetical protein QVD17_30267 [Tagetes erecta]